ncbi:MAG: S46 family peptidase [Planctomycetes bacterium]|nr:S46 family peptidase [Planctomycetota bacterium]
MFHTPLLRLLLASLTLAPLAHASRADEGMWLFNRPPAAAMKARYGFEASPEWMEHVQRSCVRVSTGGSGSIISADGLVMTNHHVASDILEKLSSKERNLIEKGFWAPNLADELTCPDLHLDVLWTITDVTERIDAAAKGLGTAEAGAAKRKEQTRIEDEAKRARGLHCEVVTLYQGGRYHLYEYKRFEDVRLVFAPETQSAFYGGDNDNFEYPRYCLDATFFRIYENGSPLKAQNFLRWSANGAADGELCFVAGHPGSTQRLNTVAHLEYLRDVSVPRATTRLMRAEVWLQTFSGRSAENARIARGDLFSVQNSRKVYVGRLAGLFDPQVLAHKRAAEEALREAVDANSEWKAAWSDAWEKIAQAQATAAILAPRYGAVGQGGLSLGTETFAFAKDILRLADELGKPSGERLREYADAGLDALKHAIFSPAPLYPEFEMMRLEMALSNMAETLGGNDPIVLAALAGRSPRARAEECVKGTTLFDLAERVRLVEGGKAAVDASKDPMIELARALDPFSRQMRKQWEDEVTSVERENYAKVAAARFAVDGENVYPDATFTLRLSYGTVKGYEQNGAAIQPFTTLGGAYAKAEERASEAAYALPKSWLDAKGALSLDTPFNFVSTHDIIGGNSGSPVFNRAGEVVGLIFDGNIQSLVGNYGYSDVQSRSVSVDSRGILESLRSVYGAERLVKELEGARAKR